MPSELVLDLERFDQAMEFSYLDPLSIYSNAFVALTSYLGGIYKQLSASDY